MFLSPNLCFLIALRQKYCKAPCYIWKGWLIPLALWFGKDVLTSFCQFIMIYKGKIALIATMDLHMHVNMIIKFYLAKNRPLILSLSHLISKMLRLVMLSFSACFSWPRHVIWNSQGLGLDFIDCVVINLFSFTRALCLGSISLHVEYQNTNMFVLSRELGFTVNRYTLVTVCLLCI